MFDAVYVQLESTYFADEIYNIKDIKCIYSVYCMFQNLNLFQFLIVTFYSLFFAFYAYYFLLCIFDTHTEKLQNEQLK